MALAANGPDVSIADPIPSIPRSPLAVTLAVWKALFLREAAGRLFGERAGWFWLLLDPVFHISYLMVMFSVIRMRHVGGIDTPLWIMLGLIGYFMFQHASSQAMRAIGANTALFVYRQVLPVDTVLVRAALEAVIMLVVAVLLLAGAWMFGIHVTPAEPLKVLDCLFSLWLIGLGFGAAASAFIEMVPESAKVLSMVMQPLYLLSGVMFPVAAIPPPYRDWLVLNPLVHGLDSLRLAFAPYYHEIPGVDMNYLHAWALGLLVLGLALQVVFAKRLVSE